MAQQQERWRVNVRAIKDRVRLRLRTSDIRQALLPSAAVRGKTGLVVARVFKGNVVFTRIAHNLAAKLRIRDRNAILPSLRRLVAAVFPAAAFLIGGPAHAEGFRAHEDRFGQGILDELAAKKKLLKVRIATLDDELKTWISEDSATIRLLRAIAVPVLGNVCHVFMHGLNRTEVHGLEKLQKALLDRSEGRGLVTVSNHVAAMDDPLVTASLLSPQTLLHERMLRWTLCATDRCFTSVSRSVFFSSLKVLPVSRGQGIHQEGMDLALEKLNRGDWVHIFPEGSRSRDGGKTLGHAKRGVGRLILDAEKAPVIIPFIHDGMQEVLPIGSKFPHICKKVTVLVGDPIPIDDLTALRNARELSNEDVYDAIAQRVGETMQKMKGELDQLIVAEEKQVLENNQKLYVSRRASGIWERIDWEMEGFSVQDIIEERDKRESPSLDDLYKQQHEAADSITSWGAGLEDDLQSITSRLKSYGDPVVFMSFAAKGLQFNITQKTPPKHCVSLI